MIRKAILTAIPFLAVSVAPAAAYVGPGAGISLLGALWGVLAAIVVAVGFVLFWPLRRLARRRRAGSVGRGAVESADAGSDGISSSTDAPTLRKS